MTDGTLGEGAGSGDAGLHESFLRYRGFRYLKLAIIIALASLVGYLVIEVEPVHNGGSWYGYLLGTVGALLIVWLTMLGVRKRSVSRRRWSLKAWTSAHVYLGLSLLVVGTLHTGFQFGWNIHTLAYALMVVVIVSGIYGVLAYARIPRLMSNNRASTSQQEMLDEITAIDRQIRSAAATLDETFVRLVERATTGTVIVRNLRTRFSGVDRSCATAGAIVAMRRLAGSASGGTPAAVTEVIKLLERKGALLRRARAHVRLRALLEVWLIFHVPFSLALLAALTAHVVSVFFYW